MNLGVLHPEIQQYIHEHLNYDINRLLLSKDKFDDVSNKEIVAQIKSAGKAKVKLPTWYNTTDIYYPPPLSIEQSTDEKVAAYKASLFQGKHLLDMTGGMGVDDYYFSKQFESVTHCEINKELSQIVSQNYKVLGISNVVCVAGNSIEWLKIKVRNSM